MTKDFSKWYNIKILPDVVNCESSFHRYALGDGDYRSRGIAQISKYYHPDVSDEQAYNPLFSIRWMVDKISGGQGRLWTCYRKLTKN